MDREREREGGREGGRDGGGDGEGEGERKVESGRGLKRGRKMSSLENKRVSIYCTVLRATLCYLRLVLLG